MREIFGSALLILIAGMASAGGVGGAQVLTPLILTIFNYSHNQTVPIVYGMLFGASIGNFLSVYNVQDPVTRRPVINYDVVLICLPVLFIGNSIGMITSKSLPPIVTLIGMITVCYTVLKKTYARLEKQWQSEEKQRAQDAASPDVSVEKTAADDENEKKVQHVQFPVNKIMQLVYLVLAMMMFTLIKGSASLPSFVGVEYCGGNYWFVHFLSILACLFFLRRNLAQYKPQVTTGQEADNKPVVPIDSDVKADKIPGLLKISTIAGVLSGMLVGGGNLVNAYLLNDLNLTPQAVSATMSIFLMIPNFMMMFSSLVAGKVPLYEWLWFMMLSVSATFIIASNLTNYAKKYNKQSILLVLLCTVLVMVMIVVPTYGMSKMYYNPAQVLSFSPIC
jgi:uncharacterized membrane protein YfcA